MGKRAANWVVDFQLAGTTGEGMQAASGYSAIIVEARNPRSRGGDAFKPGMRTPYSRSVVAILSTAGLRGPAGEP